MLRLLEENNRVLCIPTDFYYIFQNGMCRPLKMNGISLYCSPTGLLRLREKNM